MTANSRFKNVSVPLTAATLLVYLLGGGELRMIKNNVRTSPVTNRRSPIAIAIVFLLSMVAVSADVTAIFQVQAYWHATGDNLSSRALENPDHLSPNAALLVEDFSYPTGQLTDLGGGGNVSGGNWIDFSGTGNPIMVSSPSLTYSGYAGSGTGNKISIIAATTSSEDAYRGFDTQTSGTVYAAILVNVTDTNLLPLNSSATGEYITGFLPSTSTSTFASRVLFRQGTAPNTFQIGIRASGNAGNVAEFSTVDRPVGTPVLIVFSYEIVAGATNDVTKMWINPALGGTEPAPTVTQVAAAEIADVSRVFIRQGSSSGVSTPNADIDGIRVGTTWADVAGAPAPTVQFSAATFSGGESQSAVITITRTGDTSGTSSVTFSTVAGGTATEGACGAADYAAVSQTVNFAATETSKTVNIPLCQDALAESTETVNLALTNPSGGTTLGSQSTAVLSITDAASQYRNTTPITVASGAAGSPYPSNIDVTGAPTSIFRIRVTLYDFMPTPGNHVDVLLVGPNGAKYVLMAHVGVPNPPPGSVTLTFFDAAPNVLPTAAPLTSGTFLPTSCDPIENFPAPAPVGPYTDPGCDVPRSTAETLYGTFSGSNANGTWSLYVRDEEAAGTPTVGTFLGGWGIEFVSSTAADAKVSGRVLTADGNGLRGARVTMIDSRGMVRTVTTSSLGYYLFDEVEIGETYVIGVVSRRYRFASRPVTVDDSLTEVDFVGIE